MTRTKTAARLRGRTLKANGAKVYYEEHGTGVPLILLHGSLDCTGAMWARQVPRFAKRCRVIVPDARGHGRTNNPAGEINLPILAEDVAAFTRAMGLEKPFLCGLSMGGMTALEVGMRHPELFGAIIVVAAMVHRDFPDEFMAGMKALGMTGPGVVDTDLFERTNPARVAALRAMHHRGRHYWKRLLQQLSGMFLKPLLHPAGDYRKLVAPTLVIVGDRDLAFRPEDVLEMYRHLPNAELAVLPGADHTSFLGAPDGLFEKIVLDYLARLPQPIRHKPPVRSPAVSPGGRRSRGAE